MEPPALERARRTTPADTSADAGDTDSATPRRAPAGTEGAEVSDSRERLRSQTVTSKPGRGGRRTPPYAFTEQGVAMLSSVLRSERAVAVNVEIMRAFVHLRQMLESHVELAKKLDALEMRSLSPPNFA
jgi:hypothetical protein